MIRVKDEEHVIGVERIEESDEESLEDDTE